MPSKIELTELLDELEEEYRFWMVEAISLDRGVESLEEKIDQHEEQLGVDRVAEFRVRLNRTRDRHSWIEHRLLTVRQKLHELRARLSGS